MAKFSRVVFSIGQKGKKTPSAKAKKMISAKKGTAIACNITYEITVARAREYGHSKGFSKNQPVTTPSLPKISVPSSLWLPRQANDLRMTFKS